MSSQVVSSLSGKFPPGSIRERNYNTALTPGSSSGDEGSYDGDVESRASRDPTVIPTTEGSDSEDDDSDSDDLVADLKKALEEEEMKEARANEKRELDSLFGDYTEEEEARAATPVPAVQQPLALALPTLPAKEDQAKDVFNPNLESTLCHFDLTPQQSAALDEQPGLFPIGYTMPSDEDTGLFAMLDQLAQQDQVMPMSSGSSSSYGDLSRGDLSRHNSGLGFPGQNYESPATEFSGFCFSHSGSECEFMTQAQQYNGVEWDSGLASPTSGINMYPFGERPRRSGSRLTRTNSVTSQPSGIKKTKSPRRLEMEALVAKTERNLAVARLRLLEAEEDEANFDQAVQMVLA